jgi:hypothetical protein
VRALLTALVLTLIAACAPAGPRAPEPALRTDESAAGDAALAAAAAALVGAPSVRLADDAFRTTPEITVEADPGRTLEGPRDGRLRGRPVRLRLELDGQGCRLRRTDDDAVRHLDEVRCAAVAGGP